MCKLSYRCSGLILLSVLILMPVLAIAGDTSAIWSYALLGTGVTGVAVNRNASPPELYVNCTNYWIGMRYNAAKADYVQTFVSPYYSSSITKIKVADVSGDGSQKIIVATQDGRLQIFSSADKSLQNTITASGSSGYSLTDFDVVDVDRDGSNEFVILTSYHIYIYSTTGSLKWDSSSIGGNALAIAQMDSDSALEIATTDGHVVDGATHSIEWDWTYDFGTRLGAADIDGDGYAELIVAESSMLWAYDVNKHLPKWSVSLSYSPGTMLVTDIDADGHFEIIIGTYYSITAYDSVTLAQKWTLQNSNYNSMYSMDLADTDSDGAKELLWCNGYGLIIANWQSGQVKWQSLRTTLPPIGPEIGDVDGDGRDEMIFIAQPSDYSYIPLVFIFDAATRNLRAICTLAQQSYSNSIYDFKLRDVNGDGKKEMMTAGYNGIQIYSINSGNNISLLWNNQSSNYSSYYTVDAADVDGDGQVEIIAGSGGYLYVFTYPVNPGPLEWQSLYLRGNVNCLELADIDQDGIREIIAMVQNGDIYIFNGASKELEAMIMGPFTTMHVQKVRGILSIVLGKNTGELSIYSYSAGDYIQTYKQKLIPTSIDAITIDPNERFWLSSSYTGYSGGSGTLRQVTLNGRILATYAGYGQTLGLRMGFIPSEGFFYTAGYYSLMAFPISPVSGVLPDFDGDGKTDVTVWRPDSGTWYSLFSGVAGSYASTQWGLTTDMPVAGDYDGDVRTDIAVWRPATGVWYILPSSAPGTFISRQWGADGEVPVPADYDGDGRMDLAVWQPSDGSWYLLSSKSAGTYTRVPWGLSEDIPVPGDYDGDGKADVAVWRPATGTWYMLPSNAPGTYISRQWGTDGDLPVPADYDGDRKVDIAVWRQSTGSWYVLPSAAPGTYTGTQWGLPTDIPVTSDFDGDAMNDIAVYRPSSGQWYILPSGQPGTFTAIQWGVEVDIPISSMTGILRLLQ